MAHIGSDRLMPAALGVLRDLGYHPREKRPLGCTSRNVYCYEKDGKEEFILVQCRSHQDETDRYLVGVIVEALRQVNSVVLFLEGEPSILKIPAEFLRRIHEDRAKIGDARYTGPHNEQWRIDVYLSDAEMSPQGSSGHRYNIMPYVVRLA